MSDTHHPPAEDGHNDDHGKKFAATKESDEIQSAPMSLMLIILALIGVICGVSYWSSRNSEHKKETAITATRMSGYAPEARVIPVDYDKDYGKAESLLGGFRIEFYGATQPYCVTNGIAPEVCSREVEDIDIGKGGMNKVLQIKSREGKPGHLEIILTRTGE